MGNAFMDPQMQQQRQRDQDLFNLQRSVMQRRPVFRQGRKVIYTNGHRQFALECLRRGFTYRQAAREISQYTSW